MSILWKIWKALTAEKYRIVYDPQLGYLPQALSGHDWQMIEPDGTLSVYGDGAWGRHSHKEWCKTDEEAGNRINRRSQIVSQKVVWKS